MTIDVEKAEVLQQVLASAFPGSGFSPGRIRSSAASSLL